MVANFLSHTFGVFDIPASKDQLATVLMLRANPELEERMSKETKAVERS
jgi:hypothetical protein